MPAGRTMWLYVFWGARFQGVAKHACTAVLLTRGAPNAMANHAMKLALSVQSCAAMLCTAWRRSTTPQCCFMAPVRCKCPAGRPRTCIDAMSCARSVHCEIRWRPAGSTSWVPALHAAGRQHTHQRCTMHAFTVAAALCACPAVRPHNWSGASARAPHLDPALRRQLAQCTC